MKIELKDISQNVKIQAGYCPMDNEIGGRFSLSFWNDPTTYEYENYTSASINEAQFVIDIFVDYVKQEKIGTIIFSAENKKEIEVICSESFERWDKSGITWLFYRQTSVPKDFVYKRANVPYPEEILNSSPKS